jgi:release factor glutamine methyltransferase
LGLEVPSKEDAARAREPGSLRQLLGEASARLERAGVDAPERDARLLAAAAIGCSAAELITRRDCTIEPDANCRMVEFVRRRAAREPVSRILGSRGFFGREFALSPATLDPRPDSEALIEAVLAFVETKDWYSRSLRILDVGTGSGCLLLTLLAELPLATGFGTDISTAALETAASNARQLGVSDRVRFMPARGLEGVAGPFDILVCNPPYIASGDISGLEPEVRDFDPLTALDGGADGLQVYRQIISAIEQVVPSGFAALEVGAGQADAVGEMLRGVLAPGRLAKLGRHLDLGGHTRCVSLEIQL